MRIGESIPYIGLIVELHPFNLFLAFNFFLFLDVVPSFQVDTLISRALCECFSRGGITMRGYLLHLCTEAKSEPHCWLPSRSLKPGISSK